MSAQDHCVYKELMSYMLARQSVRTEKQQIATETVQPAGRKTPCWSPVCTTVFNKDAMLEPSLYYSV